MKQFLISFCFPTATSTAALGHLLSVYNCSETASAANGVTVQVKGSPPQTGSHAPIRCRLWAARSTPTKFPQRQQTGRKRVKTPCSPTQTSRLINTTRKQKPTGDTRIQRKHKQTMCRQILRKGCVDVLRRPTTHMNKIENSTKMFRSFRTSPTVKDTPYGKEDSSTSHVESIGSSMGRLTARADKSSVIL